MAAGSTGPDPMITARLSGCMFGVGSGANNHRLVSPIEPMGSAGGSTRAGSAERTTFGYQDPENTLVCDGNQTSNASGIGTRRHERWHICAQRLGAAQPPDGNMPDGNIPDGNIPDGNMPGGNMPGGNMPGAKTPDEHMKERVGGVSPLL